VINANYIGDLLKSPGGRPRIPWDDNIKIHPREVGFGSTR
jgi:hypothetical protein